MTRNRIATALIHPGGVIDIAGGKSALDPSDKPGAQLKIISELAAANKAVPVELERWIRFVQFEQACIVGPDVAAMNADVKSGPATFRRGRRLHDRFGFFARRQWFWSGKNWFCSKCNRDDCA